MQRLGLFYTLRLDLMDGLQRLVHLPGKNHMDFLGLAKDIRAEIEHLKRGLGKVM